MSEFDNKAGAWDANPMHLERSKAIAARLLEIIPVDGRLKALEFGAGTGLLKMALFMIPDSPDIVGLMLPT